MKTNNCTPMILIGLLTTVTLTTWLDSTSGYVVNVIKHSKMVILRYSEHTSAFQHYRL